MYDIGVEGDSISSWIIEDCNFKITKGTKPNFSISPNEINVLGMDSTQFEFKMDTAIYLNKAKQMGVFIYNSYFYYYSDYTIAVNNTIKTKFLFESYTDTGLYDVYVYFVDSTGNEKIFECYNCLRVSKPAQVISELNSKEESFARQNVSKT